jgi:hypothetical protein
MLAQGGGINDQSAKRPQYRISKDGGKSWMAPQELNSEIGVGGMIRLKSGALGIYGRKNGPDANQWPYYFSKCSDEAKTWSAPTLISDYPKYIPMYHSLIQLNSGRLLLSGYWEGLNAQPPDLERHTGTGWGFWRGRILFMEGHRGVEMGICVTFYSDDDGGRGSHFAGDSDRPSSGSALRHWSIARRLRHVYLPQCRYRWGLGLCPLLAHVADS